MLKIWDSERVTNLREPPYASRIRPVEFDHEARDRIEEKEDQGKPVL